MTTSERYTNAWAELNRRKRLGWMIPGGCLLGSWIMTNFSRWVPPVLFIAGVILWFVMQNRYERWPCPRCGKRFTAPGMAPSACIHCGLERGA